MAEGHTLEDASVVVLYYKEKWLMDEKWREYLRPVTLFSEKFADKLDEARNADTIKKQSQYQRVSRELDLE